MQTNTTRDKTIDFIKGILILFVILGHTTLGLTDMYSFDDTMNGIANVNIQLSHALLYRSFRLLIQ